MEAQEGVFLSIQCELQTSSMLMNRKLTQTSGADSTQSSILIPRITQGTNEKRVFSCNKSGKDVVGIKK